MTAQSRIRTWASTLKRALSPSKAATVVAPVVAILTALVVVGVLLHFVRIDPIAAYRAIYNGSLGSYYARVETLVKMTPLLLAAVAVTVAYRSRIWNLGVEGQLFMGAVFATGAGLFLGPLPRWIHLPLVILFGFLGGALWAAVPALLKVKLGVSEVIVTVMMNSISFQLVSYLVNGPWKDPAAVEPYTSRLPPSTALPILLVRTRLHAGLLLALAAVGVIYVLINHTVLGYRLRAVGLSPKAARYAGINVNRTIVLSLLISGGLAGLAGVGEVMGIWHRLIADISPGYGYTAIVVALLGRLNPIGVLASSFLFAALVVGADSMQRAVGAPAAVVMIVQALIILGVLASDYFVQAGKTQRSKEQ